MREQFTGYERDSETGLDYAQARYCSSSQGRFTSPDPLMASARATDPQSWNRYAYVGNSPMVFSDPSGMSRGPAGMYSSIRDTDRPPASRGNNTILDEAQAEYEESLANTLAAIAEADSINDALRNGTITEEEATERAAKNPMLKVETQDPAEPAPPPTNCELLANTVGVFAAREQGDSILMANLQDRFIEGPGQPPTNEFASSGFKGEFREPPGTPGGSPNQVRHYVGMLTNSYFGARAANAAFTPYSVAYKSLLRAANSREEGNSASNDPDRRLNAFAVAHGAKLAYGLITAKDLVKLIQSEVCKKSP